jgi:hypothetical protein
MANTISNLDPILALVNFTQDIKPFHSKLIEVLVEYVYSENIKVSVTELFDMKIDSVYDFSNVGCMEGYGTQPWGETYVRKLNSTVDMNQCSFEPINERPGTLITSSGQSICVINIEYPNILYVAGDQTSTFPIGTKFTIANTFSNDGEWRVIEIPVTTTQPQRNENHILTEIPVTKLIVECISDKITLRLFAAYSTDSAIGASPVNLRSMKNVMYVTGDVSQYFSVGNSFTITNSNNHHNGSWLINKICNDITFSELTVQHVTDTTADGIIYSSVIPDPTVHWATGTLWYAPTPNELSEWDGSNWILVTPPVVANTPPVSPVIGEYWYKTSSQTLFQYSVNSVWITIDSQYFVLSETVPVNDLDPMYNHPIIDPLSPTFNIINVESLTQPLIPFVEGFNGNTGCSVASTVFDSSFPSATFSVAGQQTASFSVGSTFIIKDSTGNDGVWNVSSVQYKLLTNTTEVTALFAQISTVVDATNGNPSELFMTWDPIYGYGVAGLDLNIPLISGDVEILNVSNFDLPNVCSRIPSTTALTKIKETVDFEIGFPTQSVPVDIVSVTLPVGENPGTFVVVDPSGPNDLTHYFVPGSIFIIEGSGNNDGEWTVAQSTYDPISTQTTIVPVEPLPGIPSRIEGQPQEIVLPYGQIVEEVAVFSERINVDIDENVNPAGWGYMYYSAPTTPIIGIDIINNTVTVKGDLRRMFSVGSQVTIQQSVNDIGAWNWVVTNIQVDTVNYAYTTITLSGGTLISTLQMGTLSGQPTWLSGRGWGQGWSSELDPWLVVTTT